jgi:hypothetical protein
MSGRVALPFLTLGPEAISATPWLIGFDDAPPEPAQDHLKDWDYAAAVTVRRTLEVNLAAAALALEIPEHDLSIALVLALGTGSARLPRDVRLYGPWPIDVAQSQLTIEKTVPGSLLSGALHLETVVMLSASPARRRQLSPWRIGARLWADALKVRLEGEESRFPLEVASFSRIFSGSPMQSALWHLDWRPGDWAKEFNGAVRLLINADNPAFVERVLAEDTATLQALLGDVMIQIVEQALADKEIVASLGSMEAETLGGQAASWIELAWPGQTPEYTRGLMLSHPGRVRSALQSAAALEAKI